MVWLVLCLVLSKAKIKVSSCCDLTWHLGSSSELIPVGRIWFFVVVELGHPYLSARGPSQLLAATL